jgi:hypothetical protein
MPLACVQSVVAAPSPCLQVQEQQYTEVARLRGLNTGSARAQELDRL